MTVQRPAVHAKPAAQSASLVQSPVKTQTPRSQVKPGSVHGIVSEHSTAGVHRPSTHSSPGAQSARVTHSEVQRPPTQRSPGEQSESRVHGPRPTQRPSSQRSPPRQSRSPRQVPGAGTHAQDSQTRSAGQSVSDAQRQGVPASASRPASKRPPESSGLPASSSPSRCERLQPVMASASERASEVQRDMAPWYVRGRLRPSPRLAALRGLFPEAQGRYRRRPMNRRALSLALLSALAAAVAVACGQSSGEEEAPVDTTPIVGALELAISRNHDDTAPGNAALIEISPDELRLDHRPVITLERGRAADAEVSGGAITKLRPQLSTGSRSAATLWVNANVPYLTLAQVMSTLHGAGVREASFAVRRGTTTGGELGYMKLSRWRVAPAGTEPVAFESPARPWSDFVDHWREMYSSCREGQYIDCDGTPRNIAQGGELMVTLWARGQGMKVTFTQINGPTPEEQAAAERPRGPALIEGVRAPPPQTEEVDLGPVISEGAFNFRHQESVADDSAMSETVRPVCGTQSCQLIVEADATTPSMRVLSMIGAAYANGFTEPDLAFRMPELQ